MCLCDLYKNNCRLKLYTCTLYNSMCVKIRLNNLMSVFTVEPELNQQL